MSQTKIFGSGSSYNATEHGGISMHYDEECVNITFKYFSKDKNEFKQCIETKASLKVMTLKQIKNEQIYKVELLPKDQAVYNYLHQWTVKHKDNRLVIYAGHDELGFMLTSHSNDVMNNLNK